MYPILKRCFLVFFLSLLLFKGMAQDTAYRFIKTEFVPKIYWVNQIFKGRVKEAFSTDYNYEHDSLKYAGFVKWKFNEYGQMTDFSWQIVDRDKAHGDSTTYRFNKDHLLEETRWYNDLTDELYRVTHYTYNKSNLLKYIHVYDKHGKITDSTVFNYKKDTLYPVEVLKYSLHLWREGNISKDSVELSGHQLYRYDARNNLVVTYEYDELGRPQGIQRWKYDKNNHCIEESIEVGDHHRKLAWAYDVNEQGCFLRAYEINDGRRNFYRLNRYDSTNLVYQSICSGKMLYSEEEWKYDALGNEIYNRIQYADAPTKESTISYEYDKNGNFIRRRSSVNNVPKEMHERVVVYY